MTKSLYLAFNKPYGVISQFTSDDQSKTTLKSFGFPNDVYPVGRLDEDSEGLLLLSNDKSFVSKILEPFKGHERSYFVQVERIPTEETLHELEAGVQIGVYKTMPCKAQLLPNFCEPFERKVPIRFRKNVPTSWIELILKEGKNRQVRKMTAKVGHPCLRLIRGRIGRLKLADLNIQPGEWKEVRMDQIL